MSEWVEYMTFSGVSPMADLRRKNQTKMEKIASPRDGRLRTVVADIVK